ncbi:MAG: rhodanese-like domain-containing protein, partial [Verrucomicrobiota bacterium]
MTTTVESSVQEEAGSVSVECLAKDLGWEGGRDEGTGVLIDVRTPGEYAAVHVAGSESMPLAELDVGEVKRKRDHGETVYVLCGTGKRASNAIAQLVGEGVGGCVLVEGGLAAWEV